MKVDDELISKLEKLARLALDDEERGQLQADLVQILEMVEKLEELDLSDVHPLIHMTEVEEPMRQDAVGKHLPVEDALKNAPAHDNEHFTVPKVIER